MLKFLRRKKKYNRLQNRRFFLFVNTIFLIVAALFAMWTIVSIVKLPIIRHSPFTYLVKKNEHSKPSHILNIISYNQSLFTLANNPPIINSSKYTVSSSTSHTAILWPVHTVYPDYGAVFPFNRVVAFYGNFYSSKMGILGEYPINKVLSKLKAQVAKWEYADPQTPIIPAIDYIAITAQDSPGVYGLYSLRMPKSQIEKAIHIANEVHGLVFLDVQVGMSTLQNELPYLAQYLHLPNVELAIDPEFAMKTRVAVPGTIIGTFDASDINFAIRYLAKIVRTYHLPPKILVIHRFTEAAITNYKKIIHLPGVQIVIDMDGWGSAQNKIKTYHDVIYSEPVQFTGFKIFYKNDISKPGWHILTPEDLLKLNPRPSFIQYQ